VLNVASDAQHAFSKPVKESIALIEGDGVEGHAHAGQYVTHRFLARRLRLPNLRQLHLCVPKTSSDCDAALESPKLAG
jgi:hypothetical protein